MIFDWVSSFRSAEPAPAESAGLAVRLRSSALFGLGLALALAMLLTTAPVAAASPDGPPVGLSKADQKEYWQSRYRELREQAASLKRDGARERELYADANRRNYRRGTVRHVHRDRAMALDAKLAEVEAELEALPEAARRAGALPGWIREVELETVDLPPPGPSAIEEYREAQARAKAPPVEDDSGRNPKYLDDEKGAKGEDAQTP